MIENIYENLNQEIDNLCKTMKYINDLIYKNICLSNFAVNIIDTEIFQRLRSIKQLGTVCYVYHTATHSRFDHSIGTYHLSSEITTKLYTSTRNINEYIKNVDELKDFYLYAIERDNLHNFDKYVRELINISALCHDLGHGPFSHLFDDLFLKNCNQNNKYIYHENRSGLLLEHIIKNSVYLSKIIPSSHIALMKKIIYPDKNCDGFIFQIVSNNLNSIDIDKFDYITRDSYMAGYENNFNFTRLFSSCKIINNKVSYSEQNLTDIYKLFNMRYELFKDVYVHKKVIAAQIIIASILNFVDEYLHISQSINNFENDPMKFCEFTDNMIMESSKIIVKGLSNNSELSIDIENKWLVLSNLLKRLDTHKLYSIIGYQRSANLLYNKDDNYDKENKNQDQEHLLNIFEGISNEEINNIYVYKTKIGYITGNKQNPLDHIYVYNTKEPTKNYNCEKSNISNLLSDKYQEIIVVYVYLGDNSLPKDNAPIAPLFNKNENVQHLKSLFRKYIETNNKIKLL